LPSRILGLASVRTTKRSFLSVSGLRYPLIEVTDRGLNNLYSRQATPKTQENYGGSGLGLFISRKCMNPFALFDKN
jgi:hypothetical protein